MIGREIATAEPVRCGCCHRHVVLLRTVDRVALVEIRLGVKSPHVCPEAALHAWHRAERLRMFGGARRPGPREESPR